MPGDYELLVFDATGTQELFRASATLKDLVMLPTLGASATLTSSALEANWVNVSPSAYYQVNLYEGLYDSTVFQWYTPGTNFRDAGLSLAPGNYAVTVFGAAYEWNTPGRHVVPERHDAVGHLLWPLEIQ